MQNVGATTALAAVLILGSFASEAAINIYNYNNQPFELVLYKIDDTMNVTISNSFLTNETIALQGFGNGPFNFNFSDKIELGLNEINFSLINESPGAGYTLGWKILYESSVIAFYDCGVFNTIGCNNSDLTQGIVYTASVLLNIQDQPTAVPEPASWLLAISGIIATASLRRRPRSRVTGSYTNPWNA